MVERADGAPPLITGYASVFFRAGDPSTEYEMWPADQYGPRVVEHIMPTAFERAIKEDDVRALFNHDPALVLGRNGAGTLRLTVDAVGLRYEIDPPDTQSARDLIQSLRRGDITGSSFGFVPRGTTRREIAGADGAPGECVIERDDVQLWDVGPVTYPAYPGASSAVRAALAAVPAEVEDARKAWRQRAAAVDQLAVLLAVLSMDEE